MVYVRLRLHVSRLVRFVANSQCPPFPCRVGPLKRWCYVDKSKQHYEVGVVNAFANCQVLHALLDPVQPRAIVADVDSCSPELRLNRICSLPY